MKSILFISKSILIVMTFFLTTAHAQSIASNDGAGIALPCDSEISLNEALTELIKKYSMHIIFTREDVEGYKVRVECGEHKYTSKQALDLFLKETDLEWDASGGIITISKIPPDKPGIVTGKLVDEDTKEPIIGANVWIDDGDRKYGDATGSTGTFRIRIHRGRYNLNVSHVNYKPPILPVEVKSGKTTEINNFELPPKPIILGAVETIATKLDRRIPVWNNPDELSRVRPQDRDGGVNNVRRSVVTMPNPTAQFPAQGLHPPGSNSQAPSPIRTTEPCVCETNTNPAMSSDITMPNIRTQILSQGMPQQGLISQATPSVRPPVIMVIQMPTGSRGVQYVEVYQDRSVTHTSQNRVQYYIPAQNFYSQSPVYINSVQRSYYQRSNMPVYTGSSVYCQTMSPSMSWNVMAPLTVGPVYQPMSLNVYGQMAPLPIGPVKVNRW